MRNPYTAPLIIIAIVGVAYNILAIAYMIWKL